MNIHIHGGHRKIYRTNKTHILKGVYEAIPYANKSSFSKQTFFPQIDRQTVYNALFFEYIQVSTSSSKLVSLLNKKENQVIMVFIVNICIS